MKSLLSNAELDSLAIESDTRSGERVITRLSAFLARFVSYPSEHALVAHALWCVHTHLMDRLESTLIVQQCHAFLASDFSEEIGGADIYRDDGVRHQQLGNLERPGFARRRLG